MIKGKNVILRTIRENDLKIILDRTSDFSEVGEYFPYFFYTEQQLADKYIKGEFWNDNAGTMLIENNNGEVVGEICYFKGVFYLPGYEIGYRIYKKEYMGKGYMTEALKLFSAFLFASKEIERLEIKVIRENEESKKVAKKCSFKLEGIIRKGAFQCGRYHDMELFSLIREELPNMGEILRKQ